MSLETRAGDLATILDAARVPLSGRGATDAARALVALVLATETPPSRMTTAEKFAAKKSLEDLLASVNSYIDRTGDSTFDSGAEAIGDMLTAVAMVTN